MYHSTDQKGRLLWDGLNCTEQLPSPICTRKLIILIMYTVAAVNMNQHSHSCVSPRSAKGLSIFFLCTSPARFLKGEREEGLLKHTSEHVDAQREGTQRCFGNNMRPFQETLLQHAKQNWRIFPICVPQPTPVAVGCMRFGHLVERSFDRIGILHVYAIHF